MSAAWWRRSRGSGTGGDQDKARAYAASLAAPKGMLQVVIGAYVKRYRLSAAESAALEAAVRSWLSENDSQALRELYGSRSPLPALLVLVKRSAAAHRDELWTRWRAAATAAGHGAMAATLERLVYDEALSLDEALAIATSEAGEGERTVAEELWAERPWRGAARPVLDLKWDRLEAGQPAPGREPSELERQLSAALHRLPAEDRLVLYQHFAGGIQLEEVARLLHASPDDLSCRIRGLVERLAAELAQAGVDVADLEAMLADPRPGYQRNDVES